jgi:PhnB protein
VRGKLKNFTAKEIKSMTTEVKPVQEGFHTITPSLIVNDGARALDFYRKAFGAEVLNSHTTPDGSKVVHSEIKIGDSIFFLNDEFPEMGARSPVSLGGSSITLILSVKDADSDFARAVEAGATPVMPVAEMFWGDRWGVVMDPFGHNWAFCTHVKDVSPEEIARASKEFFSKAEDEAEVSQSV